MNHEDGIYLYIVNDENEVILGKSSRNARFVAAQKLTAPFDFWQVGVFIKEETAKEKENTFLGTIGIWLISLLLLSILSGVFIFLRKAQREAYLSNMKSTFVSNLSHELRTPLTSMRALTELLDMQLGKVTSSSLAKFKSKGHEYLLVILRESERLRRLIDNLLDFSRIERGVKQYNFEYEELNAILHRALEAFQPQLDEKGFQMELSLAEALPEVYIDADAVSQIILNLLSNAVKYSDKVKEIHIRTYLKYKREDESYASLEITDKGIGISEKEIEKIFNSFYRIDQKLSTSIQGGVGIGLTLVKQIVEDHNGLIKVNSKVNQGSQFTIHLPIKKTLANVPREKAEIKKIPHQNEIE